MSLLILEHLVIPLKYLDVQQLYYKMKYFEIMWFCNAHMSKVIKYFMDNNFRELEKSQWGIAAVMMSVLLDERIVGWRSKQEPHPAQGHHGNQVHSSRVHLNQDHHSQVDHSQDAELYRVVSSIWALQ